MPYRSLNAIYFMALAVLVAAMTAIVIAGVVFRYVLNSPLVYSFDLSTLVFAWLTFLGITAATISGAHLGIDVVVERLPHPFKQVTVLIGDVVMLAISLIVSWYALQLVRRTGLDIPSLRISIGWLYASLAAGFLLNAIYLVIRIVDRLRGTSGPRGKS